MQTIGRYELVEKLGQGGMGVVYRAFDPLLQRVVAVKLIGAIEADQELRERFFREARAAGQLSHKNIITIYDLGEHEGQPFLAMEYLEGQDLQQRMTSPAAMSLTRKLELAIEIGEGLEYAHLHGVIHRDIKPANIFITNGGIAKILDFGLARLITSELTNSNMMMGTVNYMAPEQVRGERADHRSDIFSAGVVLYELFGGRRAFEGDSFAATLYKILEETPVPLEQLDPNIPPPITAIVERAIDKTREGRYQHTGELLRDLMAYRQHLLITNSPAFGSMAQIAHDAPTIAAPAGSHPPFPPATPRPSGAVAVTTGPVSPAPAPAPAAAGGSTRSLLLAGAVAIAAIGTLIVWSATRNDAPATMSAGVGPPVPAQTEPGPEAAEAERVAQAVERGLESARGLLKAGQFEAAATAAGEVLAVAPANADAKRLMDEAATRSRGRGADEARQRMIGARGAAVAASAQTLAAASFAEAQKAQREAERLMDRGENSDAMAKFWEASGLFRSAELAANTEAAARRERARAQASPKPKEPPSRDTASPAPSPATQAPPSTPATVPATTGLTLPPAAPPVVPPSPPVQQPKQAAAPAREPEPPPEAGVAELLDRYKGALESRSLDALRRIWPGMSRSQEAAMRSDFRNANRIQVEVLGPQISVRGNNATVTFVRRYQLDTVDGQQLRTDTRTTITAHRNGGGWVIDQIRFENAP
jgi:serine/threonine-protein kinase